MGQELKPHPLNLARPIAIPKWRMVFLNISIYPGLHSLKMTVQGWHCSNPISQLQYFFQAWSHNIIFQNFGKLNIKPTSYVYIFSGMRISIWHTLFVSKKNYRLHPLALVFFFFFFFFLFSFQTSYICCRYSLSRCKTMQLCYWKLWVLLELRHAW